jgi:hypothetical protein
MIGKRSHIFGRFRRSRDFEKKRVREQGWTRDIPIPRQPNPVSGMHDPAKRHGKVLSVEEKELLAGII